MTAAIRWLGGATMELRLGGFRLLTDPVLAEGPAAFVLDAGPATGGHGGPVTRRASLPPVELTGLDALLLSQVHADHFDAVARERLPRTLWGLAPAEHVLQLEAWGFEVIEGTTWGEEHHIERAGEILRLAVLPARPSHDPATAAAIGAVNGYLVEHETARRTLRIVWTGDTVWFDELPDAARRRGPVDVLIPHLGAARGDGPRGRTTLDADEAARLIAAVEPLRVLPVHHHTFSHYGEPVEALVERLAGGRFAGALRVAQEGELVRIE